MFMVNTVYLRSKRRKLTKNRRGNLRLRRKRLRLRLPGRKKKQPTRRRRQPEPCPPRQGTSRPTPLLSRQPRKRRSWRTRRRARRSGLLRLRRRRLRQPPRPRLSSRKESRSKKPTSTKGTEAFCTGCHRIPARPAAGNDVNWEQNRYSFSWISSITRIFGL